MTTQAEHLSQVTPATALRALEELEALQAERDALRAFAQGCFAEWPEQDEMDEFKLLVMAEEHGLMEKVEVKVLATPSPLAEAVQEVLEAAGGVAHEIERLEDADDFLDRLAQTGWPETARRLRILMKHRNRYRDVLDGRGEG